MKTSFLAIALCALAHAQAIGVIMRIDGDVKNGAHPAALAETISDGAKLTLAKNATVSFLFCPESIIGDATGPGTIAFSATQAVVKGPTIKRRKVAACKLPSRSAEQRLGGLTLRGENPMVLFSPVNSHVPPDAAIFQWAKVEGATTYRLTLKTEDQYKIVEQETKDPQWEMRGSMLAPGKRYRWSVTALQGEEVLSSASAWMTTLSADQQRQLQTALADWKDPNEPARALAMAFVYEDLDMPDAALAQYRKVAMPSDEIKSRIVDLEKRLRIRD